VLDLAGGTGHLAVVGGPRSGKSGALRTALLALALTHTPAELGVHVLDFGGGGLTVLADLPHVGTVAGRQQPDVVRRTVAELAAALSPEDWHLEHVADGAQGPRRYRVARQRVREVRAGVVGGELTALFRRNPDGSELKCHLTNAPAGVPTLTLARVGSARWTIETGFEQAKGEAGLDEYEVRSWAGWHHHITLALLAGLFLLQLRPQWGEKPAGAHAAPGQPGAPRTAAAPSVDPADPVGLAARHPSAERCRDAVARQAPAA
jgi:hypothetical protein